MSEGAEAWVAAVLADAAEWAGGEACPSCGAWVGHYIGDGAAGPRGRCPSLPRDVPIKAVRDGGYFRVRQILPSIAGAIRHMERAR